MIQKIKIKDIPSLFENQEFWSAKVTPVSKHKLYMMLNNPDANPEDAVIYYHTNDEGEVISTLTCFAGKLNDAAQTKFGIISSWWANPEYKGIGRELMIDAYKDNEGRVISHYFIPVTRKIYERIGTWDMVEIKDLYYLNFDFSRISGHDFLNKAKRQLQWFNNKNDQQVRQDLYDHLKGVQVELISEIDAETNVFLENYRKQDFFGRSNDSFNWIRHYPWILSNPLMEIEKPPSYYFSATRRQYELFYYKLYKQDTLVGFLVISATGRQVKLLYKYASEDYNDIISSLLQAIAFEEKITQIVLNDKGVIEALQKSPYFKSEEIEERYTMAGNNLDWKSLEGKKIHFGDCEFLMS